MGKFFKGVVKFSVAAAAVGGLCYACLLYTSDAADE